MSEELLINKVKLICKKKPNDRSPADIQELQDLTRLSKVFKNIIELSGESAHQICCKFLSYEFCPAEQYLFNVGDQGTCFYTIISGKVGVEIPRKDEFPGESKMVEVVEFKTGASFGELALESSKPRLASVRCKVDSHFVTLDKSDYNRMIAKVVREKRNNVVNFLKSLPIFAGFTKGSLTKLTYNFKEKEFTKGQVVYREGDPINEVYLVTEGEFLFQKRIIVEDGRKKKALFSEHYTDSVEMIKFRSKALNKKLVQIGKIAKMGAGELFGVEEKDGPIRKFTCVCNSSKAKVLCILKNDFYRRIKGEDTLQYIQDKIDLKDKEINSRISMWKFIAEDTASSLSPLQLRRRTKEVEAILKEERKTPPPLTSSATAQVFSKKQDNYSNICLYKRVDDELRRSGSPFETSKRSPIKSKQRDVGYTGILRNAFVKGLEKFTAASLARRASPAPNSNSGHITLYSMNSRPVYTILK